jgi:uncharacterized protein DUF1707
VEPDNETARYDSVVLARVEGPVTAGPGDQQPVAKRGHLRASHADRERMIDTLKDAFVDGRLTKDELDGRAGRALAARTYADLAALIDDLPAGLTPAQPAHKLIRARPRRRVNKPVKWIAFGFITPAMLAFTVVVLTVTGNHPAAQLILGASFIYFWAWLVAGAQMLHTWHENRSGRALPPRPAQRRRATEGERHGRTGDDLICCEARPMPRPVTCPGLA